MPADVAELLHRHEGVLVAAHARAAGIGGHRLARLVEADLLTRIGHGCYAVADGYKSAGTRERHRLHARALALSRGPDLYLTGWSGAVVRQLPVIGRPPKVPVAVRPKREGHRARKGPFGNILIADLPGEHMQNHHGVGVMSAGWIVADLARHGPIPGALVTADAAARLGVNLHDAIDHMRGWVRVDRARWVAEYADPLAETPIETLGRFTAIEFGLPMPVSNAWVGDGRPEYRLDGLWPYHWAGYEADGAQKYDNRPDASVVVSKQNEREWYVRRHLDLDLARYHWQLAFRRRKELADRFGRLLHDNPPRQEPIRWWKHVPGRGPVEPEPGDWPSPHPTSIVLPAGYSRL